MKPTLPTLALTLLYSFSIGCSPHAAPAPPIPAPGGTEGILRIGVYDSRAIAVAYAASPYHDKAIAKLAEEKSAADLAGDGRRAQAIKARGAALQTKLHLQGFARAPVDDLLDPVRDRLPEVAARAGVQVILPAPDWRDPAVQTVDLTDDLVSLYRPTPRTLRTVKELRAKKPVPVLDLLIADRSGDI